MPAKDLLRWPGPFGVAVFVGLFFYLAYAGVALEIISPAFGAVSIAAGMWFFFNVVRGDALQAQPPTIRLAVILRGVSFLLLGSSAVLIPQHRLVGLLLQALVALCTSTQYRLKNVARTGSGIPSRLPATPSHCSLGTARATQLPP
jgi:hypothetical protein